MLFDNPEGENLWLGTVAAGGLPPNNEKGVCDLMRGHMKGTRERVTDVRTISDTPKQSLDIIRRSLRTRVTPRTRQAILDAAFALYRYTRDTEALVMKMDHAATVAALEKGVNGDTHADQ